MYCRRWILLCYLLLLTGCQKLPQHSAKLPQDPAIQVYFNHRQTKNKYTDPYRQIKRPGDNLEAVIIEEIAAAKSTINLAVQEFNLPLVAQALVASQQQGVEVKVILENNYSSPLSELNPQQVDKLKQRDRLKYDQFQQLVDVNGDGNLTQQEISTRDALIILRQAGIPLIDDTADGSKGSGLMHHKFMVVDNKTVITGSANFTLSDIHGDFDNLDNRGNVNHLLRIDNQQVASIFTEEFNYLWGYGNIGGINSKFGLDKPARSPFIIRWDNTEVLIQFSPISKSKDWRESGNGLISQILNNANDSINLALFVFSEQQLVDLLQTKQQQGVTIQGVFDPGFAFRYYSEVLDMLGVTGYYRCQPESDNNPWLQPLNTIGIPDLDLGDKLHHKFAAIDQHLVIAGSQNWTAAANHLNDETVIVINNYLVAQHFEQEFTRLYQTASFGLSPNAKAKLQQQQAQCNS
ncbi:helix-hairpin-helix motif protein [Chondrocystis sp. NIES-4102]|nr:helix-hairpin-helix motif protein [Chondrocystis sp. NIES-4102]